MRARPPDRPSDLRHGVGCDTYGCRALAQNDVESESVAGSAPTPLSAAVWVPASSVTLNVPVRVPEAVGRNTTETVHPTPPGRVVPHVFALIAKSPVTVGVCTETAVFPVFETVMFCTLLDEPTFVEGYVTEIGINTTAAPAAPVPLNGTVACPPLTFA